MRGSKLAGHVPAQAGGRAPLLSGRERRTLGGIKALERSPLAGIDQRAVGLRCIRHHKGVSQLHGAQGSMNDGMLEGSAVAAGGAPGAAG